MLARITLIQTEAQLNLTEKSITDNWALTDKQGQTITAFDKDTLLATIINKGGCFGVVYQDPEYFYLMCSYFWKRWKSVFSDWYETAAIEYNPLENYDRIEEWTDTTKDVSAESNATSRSANNSDQLRRTARAIRQRLNSPKIQTAELLKIKFLLIMLQLMRRMISRKPARIPRARQPGPQPEKRTTARALPDPRMKP